MKASIIIPVYKNVRALRAILRSLQKQTEQDFEVIISEDGEDPCMKAFIQSYAFPWPAQHLTQPDQGWRKNRALNAAIKASNAEWLIFIDGDCVLHPRFVENHLRYSARGIVLAGKRVKLNAELSEKVEMSFWDKPDAEHTTMRFVTSWATTDEEVDRLIELL